jgi:GNAT superfamily N-acetyltransferase
VIVSEVQVIPADPALPESIALVQAMEREIDELYSDRPGSVHTVGAAPDEMLPPDGDFLVVREDGRNVGCGGIKRIDREACEIKRMYIVPEARGRGHSTALLKALEDRARELGYSIARLDTADRQPAALPLYEGAGYRRIPPYNDNDLAVYWFEKELR